MSKGNGRRSTKRNRQKKKEEEEEEEKKEMGGRGWNHRGESFWELLGEEVLSYTLYNSLGIDALSLSPPSLALVSPCSLCPGASWAWLRCFKFHSESHCSKSSGIRMFLFSSLWQTHLAAKSSQDWYSVYTEKTKQKTLNVNSNTFCCRNINMLGHMVMPRLYTDYNIRCVVF